jgi:hypothetical protein
LGSALSAIPGFIPALFSRGGILTTPKAKLKLLGDSMKGWGHVGDMARGEQAAAAPGRVFPFGAPRIKPSAF